MKYKQQNFLAFAIVAAFLASSISSPVAAQSAPPKTEKKQEKSDDKSSTDKNKKADSKEADKKQEDKKNDKTEPKSEAKKQETKKQEPRRRVSSYYKENAHLRGLFEPIIAESQQHTVSVLRGTRRVAYGVIVDSTGLILTKSSELRSPLKCRLPGRKDPVDATIFGVDPATDLALIKVNETMLPFQRFDPKYKSPEVGSWVAVPGTSGTPISIGIVSVGERKIPPASGFMGVQLAQASVKNGVKVDVVMPGLPADNAGVKVGDIIIEVNGTKTPNRVKLVEVVSKKRPGSKIDVVVLRGSKNKNLQIVLGDREKLNAREQARSNQQNTMSGTRSERRKDFPLAFRHDGYLVRTEVGGPVVNLDGKVVGINIARGGRVESLVLPNSVVFGVIEKLKTGNFKPSVVNKEKIELIEKQLTAMSKNTKMDDKKLELRQEYDTQEAIAEQLKKTIENIQKQIEEAEKEKKAAQAKLKKLKTERDMFEKNRRELQKELERLKSGMG